MNKIKSFLMVSAAAILLTACIAETTSFKHPNGSVASCSVSGGGFIGAAVAGVNRDRCIQKYESMGFQNMGTKNVIQGLQ